MLTMEVSRKAPEYGQDPEFDARIDTLFTSIWDEVFADRAAKYRQYVEADYVFLDDRSTAAIQRRMSRWMDEQRQGLRQEVWSYDCGFEPESADPSLETENEQLRHEMTLQREMRKAIQDAKECPECGYRFDGDES